MSRLAGYSRVMISRYRRVRPVRWLGEMADFVSSAYENEGSDIVRNGEGHLLRALAPANFRVALDVGANVGDWLMLAAAIWPMAELHAFEVARPTFEVLSSNLVGSGFLSRVTINCNGLSDSSVDGEIYYYPEHPEITSDRHRHAHTDVRRLPAAFRAGDSYIKETGIDRIDFLKIDGRI
jgi:FkbM family methyltransferase